MCNLLPERLAEVPLPLFQMHAANVYIVTAFKDTVSQIKFKAQHSGATVAFIEDEGKFKMILKVASQHPSIEILELEYDATNRTRKESVDDEFRELVRTELGKNIKDSAVFEDNKYSDINKG